MIRRCPTQHRRSRRSRGASRGFTLIETCLAVIMVGLGIVAMCQLLAAGTFANVESTELSTGMSLARNVREFALRLGFTDPTTPDTWGLDAGESATNVASYDDINDLYSASPRTFNPPIDSRGQAQASFGEWSQKITVQSVEQSDLTKTVINGYKDPTTGYRAPTRVTVEVYHRQRKICDMVWLAFDGKAV